MADKQQVRADIREFLTTRRARITPERAGLRAFGSSRRLAGLRREEVATLGSWPPTCGTGSSSTPPASVRRTL